MGDDPAESRTGSQPSGRTAGLARVCAPLVVFCLLSLLLTWPLVAHLGSHVPGDGIDDPSLAWNLWWAKHALVDQPQNPFDCRWQFWPVGINLAFYTLTLLNGALSIPLQAVFGVAPAYNLLLLSSFILGGLGAYLLCLEFLGRHPRRRGSPVLFGALLGGALYAFASSKMFYAALGQGNIASSQWAPFAALYLVRTARPRRCTQAASLGIGLRDAGLAALFMALQAYAELTFASFLLILAVLAFLWGVACLLPRSSGPPSVRWNTCALMHLFARFSLLALLFVLALTPFLANMLPDLRAEGDFFASGGGFADVFSADLAGYAFPTQLHPVLGGVIRTLVQSNAAGSGWQVDKGQHVYVGYTALALAIIGLWAGRRQARTWFWAAAAVFFFLLTLGPSLRVAGRDLGLPLPFAFIERLPFFEGNRYPSRYSIMLLLSLAPLVAAAAARVAAGLSFGIAPRTLRALPRARRRPQQAAVLLLPALGLLMLFEHLSLPLPLSDLRAPPIYDRIAAQPGDFALLELPIGWRNGARVAGKQDVVIMAQLWYQTYHGKRLLGGNTSRNPEFKFQYFSEDPTLARLIALTNAADQPQHTALAAALAAAPIGEADQIQARNWAAFNAIRYVMVHRDKAPRETEAALQALLPMRLVTEEGSLALYEVTTQSQPLLTYLVGADSGRMALAEGWSPLTLAGPTAADAPPVYAQRREARLLLPLGGARQLSLEMWALAPEQRVTLIVDGHTTGVRTLPAQRTELVFDLLADRAQPLLSDVRLRFSTSIPVSVLAQRLSRAGPAALMVRSAGQEAGDFGHVYVEGTERSPNRRGYNLVALRPDGEVLDSGSFDTHADPAASAALARWLKGLPSGVLVAGAVRDEASLNLGQEAVDALRSLGVTSDLRGRFRWGHAFIGTVAATPGSAQESLDAWRPAQVAQGLPLSGPELAAALARVTIRK